MGKIIFLNDILLDKYPSIKFPEKLDKILLDLTSLVELPSPPAKPAQETIPPEALNPKENSSNTQDGILAFASFVFGMILLAINEQSKSAPFFLFILFF
jgi:hypothetical protein